MKETPEEKAARLEAEAIVKVAEDERLAKEATDAEEAEQAKLAEETEQKRLAQEKEDAAKAEAEAVEAKRLSDIQRNTTDTITIKGVVLKGSAAQKTGSHSIHLTPSQIVNFVNGKAQVKEDVERALKAGGYIE